MLAACAKARSVAAASPKRVSTRVLFGTSSQMAGGPGCMASSECSTNGISSYAISTASAASGACAFVFATTIATASPTWRALSAGNNRCGPMKIAPPPGAVSFMSSRVFGTGSCGMAPSPSAAQSVPVYTPSTPGIASALALSIERMRACGCGERTIAAQAWPSKLKSSVNCPFPTTSRASSVRGMGCPRKRKDAGLFIACNRRSGLLGWTLDISRRSLWCQPAASPLERFVSAFLPAAFDCAARVSVIELVPVAERVTVPGRLRGDWRKVELLPQRERALHEFTLRQGERRHVLLERGVDQDGGVLALVRFRAVPGGAIGHDLHVDAGIRAVGERPEDGVDVRWIDVLAHRDADLAAVGG